KNPWQSKYQLKVPSTHLISALPPVVDALTMYFPLPQGQGSVLVPNFATTDNAAVSLRDQKGSNHFILLMFFNFLIKLNSKTKIHKLPPLLPPLSLPHPHLQRWLPFLHPHSQTQRYPTEKMKLL
uniref:Uncharacterized protein n=1 Tax=Monodelphis domestica TaxID=13616 RepID=A0A5F8HAM9_MONDO